VEGGAAGSGLEGRDECRAADDGASESWGPSSIVCTGISVLFIPGIPVGEGVGRLEPLKGACSSEVMRVYRVP
jgi:hypothetical protein